MTQGPRLWFDVSYTRTQAGAIGITRTVRRLFDELSAIHPQCRPVAFHHDGYREVVFPQGDVAAAQGEPSRQLFASFNGNAMRKMVMLGLRVAPWFMLKPLWTVASTAAFDALTSTDKPADIRAGDTVFIADASWNYPAWRCARAARAAGAHVVLLVYDLMPLRRPEFCFPLVPRLFKSWLRAMLSCSDAVLSISQATQDDLKAWAHENELQMPPAAPVRLGSDPSAVAHSGPVRASIDQFLGGAAPCFSAVGSFEPKKNYEAILDVFDALWRNGSDLRLLLAGKLTDDWPAITRRLAAQQRDAQRLLLVHDATDAELMRIYERSTALLLPSLFEGFGLPLVEARTRGCRVIANQLPCFAELADEGVTLVSLEVPGAFEQAILQHASRERPAQPSKMTAVTWGDTARQCLAAMDRMLHPAANRSGYSSASPPGESGAVPSPLRTDKQASP